MKRLSTEESIEFWKKRSKYAKDPLSKVMWPDRPIWNAYIDELQKHYLRPYIYKLRPSDIVLDVGCGVGRFTFRFAKLCKKVYGIDISEENIKLAKERAEREKVFNVEFKVMDVRKLEFDDEIFDYVFSIACLCFLIDKKDFIKGIKEVLRVTKKDGCIILLENMIFAPNYVSIPREEWFRIIEKHGGKIKYWCGVDVPILRRIIVELPFGLLCHFVTRRNWKVDGNIFEKDRKILELYMKEKEINKKIENITMKILTNIIKPFEYTIPKFLKNQSIYTLIEIFKQT